MLPITDARIPAVLEILHRQSGVPDPQVDNALASLLPGEELVKALAKPDFATVLKNMIKTISSAGRDFALATEFGRFLDLAAQGQTDVKLTKLDDGSFKQEYFLGNPDKPIVSLSYSIADKRIQFTKLEILSASGELLSTQTPKLIFDLDKTAFHQFNKDVFTPAVNNHLYLEEFISSKDKQQKSTSDGIFVAAKRDKGSKPWLVAHLEKSAAGLRLKAFGKSDSPVAVSEPITLGPISSQQIIEDCAKINNFATENASGISNAVINLGTLAQAQAILAKANAELLRFDFQQKARVRANSKARVEEKTINDYISSDHRQIVAAAELQLIGFTKALPALLQAGKVETNFESSSEPVRGLLGESLQQEVNSLVLKVPNGGSFVKITVPFVSRESGIQAAGFLISNLQFLDPVSQKATSYSLDLSSKMEAVDFQNSVNLLKPSIKKLLAARSQQELSTLGQKLESTKLKIVSSPKVEGIGYAAIGSDDKHAFVMKFDLNSKALVSLAHVPLANITINYESLSRIISAAESYIYGKPAGGKEAANSGGTALLYLGDQEKQKINARIGEKINLAIKNQQQIASFRQKLIDSTLNKVVSPYTKPKSATEPEIAYATIAPNATEVFVMQFDLKSKTLIAVTQALDSRTNTDFSFENLAKLVGATGHLYLSDPEKREIDELLESKVSK